MATNYNDVAYANITHINISRLFGPLVIYSFDNRYGTFEIKVNQLGRLCEKKITRRTKGARGCYFLIGFKQILMIFYLNTKTL